MSDQWKIVAIVFIVASVASIGLSTYLYYQNNSNSPSINQANATRTTGNQTQIMLFSPVNVIEIGIVFGLIVALVMVTPLVVDLYLAYSKKRVNETGRVLGLEGLGRTMMMVGIVLVLGLVLFYLLGTFTFTIQTGNNKFSESMFDVIKNTTTILAGAVSAIIAFYFGNRAMESGMEKARAISTGITEEKIGPRILYTDPANGTNQINRNADIKAAFNTRIDGSTIESPVENFKVRSGNLIILGVVSLVEASVAKFHPQNPLPVGKITCTVTKEVKDIEGNAMQEEYSWSFDTI
jgi:hypothetical protein